MYIGRHGQAHDDNHGCYDAQLRLQGATNPLNHEKVNNQARNIGILDGLTAAFLQVESAAGAKTR